MACYEPLTGFRSRTPGKNGGYPLTFDPSKSIGQPMTVPCGQCLGCRLAKSREWALRCVHEAQMHDQNCFITLTYRPEDLPCDGSLNKAHFQKFMKRLRKTTDKKIRYFHCGEYGDQLSRPHYHACLFGYDFADKSLHSINAGQRLYISQTLQDVWGMGFATIGTITFESAAYVARYAMKKQTGDKAEGHYQNVNVETGELTPIIPEYTTMSLKPGIGHDWLMKYTGDVFPDDKVTHNGVKTSAPKYYRDIYEKINKEHSEQLKKIRIKNAKSNKENNTPERLYVRRTVKEAQLKQLKRTYENGT